MDPGTGDVYELRRELLDADIGDQVEMETFRRRVAALGEHATRDETDAIRAQRLVAVSEQAARKLKLGQREIARRRRRRR